MNLHPEKDTYSQAGNWLMGTARRHPEALLLLAAGCALLMRSSSSSSRASTHSRQAQSDFAQPSTSGRGHSNARQGLSRAVESAADYASDIKDQVSDTASNYAETVSEFAGEAGRKVSQQSERFARQAQSTMQSTMARVLRDQPLVVAPWGSPPAPRWLPRSLPRMLKIAHWAALATRSPTPPARSAITSCKPPARPASA